MTMIRINDVILLEAQAEAARLGVTVTEFIEDTLRRRFRSRPGRESLPVFDSGIRLAKGFDIKALRDDDGRT